CTVSLAAVVRAVHALRDGGSVVVVAGGFGASRTVAASVGTDRYGRAVRPSEGVRIRDRHHDANSRTTFCAETGFRCPGSGFHPPASQLRRVVGADEE